MTTEGALKIDLHVRWYTRFREWLPILMLGAVMFGALFAMTRQWDKPLLDMHSFRQTQTAISTYYMADDVRVFFDYTTPVLGKPWQIPMELPIYQWLVARLYTITGMELDHAGKVVSILFWFLCAWPMWRLLKVLGLSSASCANCLSLVFSSPLYLYWGRAFMMESVAMFLSLCMTSLFYSGYKRGRNEFILFGIIFGCLAALTKVTTWSASLGVLILLIVWTHKFEIRQRWFSMLVIGLSLLPIIPARLWLAYGDSMKMQNPFAREILISSSVFQRIWNFGTIADRFDPSRWESIWENIVKGLCVCPRGLWVGVVAVILVSGLVANVKWRLLILVFCAGFIFPPVIFINLYSIHEYYWFANGIWLLVSIGISLAAIAERFIAFNRFSAATIITVALILSGFFRWEQRHLPVLEKLISRKQLSNEWSDLIQRILPPGRTMMVIGNDWDPTPVYYSKRKSMSVPAPYASFPSLETQVYESLANLGADEKLGALVINKQLLQSQNEQNFYATLHRLGIARQGIPSRFGVIFPAIDLQ